MIKLILKVNKTMMNNIIVLIKKFIKIMFKIINQKVIKLNNVIPLIIISLIIINKIITFKVKVQWIMIILIKR